MDINLEIWLILHLIVFVNVNLKWALDDGKCNLNMKTEEMSTSS